MITELKKEDVDVVGNAVYLKPEKYFLCYGFDNFSPVDLEKFHVTLIYFGAENGWKIQEVIEEVDKYMNLEITTRFCKSFSEPALFGRNKDIPVLLPVTPMEVLENLFHKDLRDRLEKFLPGKDFPFNPHLTTDLMYFKGEVNALYLCGRGYKIIKQWML